MEDMVIIHKVYRFLDYPTFIKAMLVFCILIQVLFILFKTGYKQFKVDR